MRSRARSLRFKLTLWFVLVFFVIQTILTGGIVLLRRGLISQARDDELVAAVEGMIDNILIAKPELRLASASTRPEGDPLASLAPRDAEFDMYAVRDAEGVVLAASAVPPGVELPFSSWEAVPAGTVGAVFTPIGEDRARGLGADDALRMVTVPFRFGEETYYFQAAVRDRVFLGPFFDLVVIGGPVGLIAAMFAAWIIAGRAVSPMDRLSEAARGLSPTSLDTRFRVETTDEEVSRLERELNSALERLEAGYQAQDQFISNVSHELKTPIAVLLTEAQVAKLGSTSGEKAAAFISQVESEMKRLGKLVESMLTLARADILRDRPLENVPVNDIVLQSVQHCTTLARQNKTHLIPNLAESENGAPEPVVEGDAALLQTMVDNLVRNAIAQSPNGGRVAIDARCSDGRLELIVTDAGPGIPEEYLEKIFDRFVQVPREEGRTGREGMGLGLTIANGVAQLHHGTIVARNNEERGCSFVVTLPLAKEA